MALFISYFFLKNLVTFLAPFTFSQATAFESLRNDFLANIIASPKGEANNRIRRKKKALSLCMSVCNAP
jgi:hypothetical protein